MLKSMPACLPENPIVSVNPSLSSCHLFLVIEITSSVYRDLNGIKLQTFQNTYFSKPLVHCAMYIRQYEKI